jgi:cholesterol transport system auxiliary component
MKAASSFFQRRPSPACAVPALLAAVLLTGCAIVDKPQRAVVYDLGPAPASAAAAAASTSRVYLLPEVSATSALDSTAVLYRLAYDDAQMLHPYAQARWSMTPAQLLHQRLRQALVARGLVLAPVDLPSGAVPGAVTLLVELDEFDQVFAAPSQSTGVVRLQVTALRSTSGGDSIVGQRSLALTRAAASADARGGVHAMTAATDAAVEEIAQWLTTLR